MRMKSTCAFTRLILSPLLSYSIHAPTPYWTSEATTGSLLKKHFAAPLMTTFRVLKSFLLPLQR